MKTITKVEKFTEQDIPGLVALSASVGWDYDDAELRTVFGSGEIFGHRNENGDIISSAAIISYGPGLASLGLVIVHPGWRGHGLGKHVTERCLEAVPSGSTVILCATPQGRPVYERIGFSETGKIKKYIAHRYAAPETIDSDGLMVLHLTYRDMEEVLEMDRMAVGADRELLLKNRVSQANRKIVARDADGKLAGYCLTVKGPENLVVGPVVARDDKVALLLVDEAVSGYQGKIRIDVPEEKSGLCGFLLERGFSEAANPPVMALHADAMPTRNGTLYGLCAQVFG